MSELRFGDNPLERRKKPLRFGNNTTVPDGPLRFGANPTKDRRENDDVPLTRHGQKMDLGEGLRGFIEGAKEVPSALAHGAIEGVNDVIDFAMDMAVGELGPPPVDVGIPNPFDEPETPIGNVAKETGRFAAPLIPVGKPIKAAKNLLRAGKAVKVETAATDAAQVLRVEKEVAEEASKPSFQQRLVAEQETVQLEKEASAKLTPDELLKPLDDVPTVKRGKRDVPVAGNINLERQALSAEAKAAEVRVAQANDAFKRARGVVPQEEIALLADEAGLDINILKGKGFTSAAILQKRNQLATSADELVRLAQGARGGSDEAVLNFQEGLVKHVGLQEEVAEVTSEIGRALNQFKIQAKTEKVRQKLIRDIIESNGGRDTIEAKAKLLADLDDPVQFGVAVRKMQKATTKDKVVEAWINGLLSGPQTHLVNAGSNALVAAYTVPERFLAAGFGSVEAGARKLVGAAPSAERVFAREAMAKASGMIKGMRRATIAAQKQFRFEEAPELFSRVSKIEGRREAIGGKLGRFIRIPSRALESADVWFKMVNYSGELEALAARRAIKEGLSGQAMADDIARTLKNPSEALQAKAWRVAETNTFTLSLREQEGILAGAGKRAQSLAQEHLTFKTIFPFVRTPTNILKFSLERSPLGLVMKDQRKAIMAGGAARNEALAKVALGTSVIGASYELAANGIITGGGPSDSNAKRVLRDSSPSGEGGPKWQPYSILVGDTYYSYARMEPLGTMLGVAADSFRIMNNLTDKEKEKYATVVLSAIAKNATNKTFLRGLTEAIRAADPGNPSGNPQRFLEQLVASFATPTIASTTTKAIDPTLRDVRGIQDRLMSRTPGLSDKVQPLLNVWGENIKRDGGFGNNMFSPIYISKQKGDRVSNEMVRLGVSPSMPRREIGGVDLTPEQYTKYQRLAGRAVKAELDGMVGTRFWRDTPDSDKEFLILDAFSAARKEARAALAFDDESLAKAIEEEEMRRLQ